MEQIKPCPFCGYDAGAITMNGGDKCICSNVDCVCHVLAFDIGAWNDRPIEDAIKAGIVDGYNKAKTHTCTVCDKPFVGEELYYGDWLICPTCALKRAIDTLNDLLKRQQE